MGRASICIQRTRAKHICEKIRFEKKFNTCTWSELNIPTSTVGINTISKLEQRASSLKKLAELAKNNRLAANNNFQLKNTEQCYSNEKFVALSNVQWQCIKIGKYVYKQIKITKQNSPFNMHCILVLSNAQT